MSKKPRPSLQATMSAIAGIAKQGVSPEPETTSPNDHADTLAREPVATLSREHATTPPREHVRTRLQETEAAPKGFNVRRARIEKPHQSIYAHPDVFRVIRQIAATEDVKPQDLYREALRLMLAKRGLDFDQLDAGKGG